MILDISISINSVRTMCVIPSWASMMYDDVEFWMKIYVIYMFLRLIYYVCFYAAVVKEKQD